MEKNNKIYQLSKLKKSLLMILMSGVLGLTGCGEKQDKPFLETLEEVEDNTCLDDVLEANDDDILEEVSLLEEYIKISEKIPKILLYKYVCFDVDGLICEIPETMIHDDYLLLEDDLTGVILLPPEEIRVLLEEFSKLPEEEIRRLLDGWPGYGYTYEVVSKLVVQKCLVNQFILEKGYRIAGDVSLLTLKSKIADAFEYDAEESVDLVNSISIPSEHEANYNNPYRESWMDSIIVDGKEVFFKEDLVSLLDNVYMMQKNTGNVGYDYNEERNWLISDTLDHTKKVLVKEYNLKVKEVK